MNNLKILSAIKKPLIIYTSIITTLILVPNKNFVSILTIILLGVLSLDLWTYKKPKAARWTKTILTTTAYVGFFALLYFIAGGWGILGILVIIILLAAWRIYNQWSLYWYTCQWIAGRLKGSKQDFDLTKVQHEKRDS